MNLEVKRVIAEVVARQEVKKAIKNIDLDDILATVDDTLPGLEDDEVQAVAAYANGLIQTVNSQPYFNPERVNDDGTVRTEAELRAFYDAEIDKW